MKIGMIIFEWLEMNNDSLPLQNPMMQTLKIYAKRSTVFLSLICANLIILWTVVVIHNLNLAKVIHAIIYLYPLLWLSVILLLLVFLQRLLHRENRAVLLIATRNSNLTTGLFLLLFFPGVLLYELSHFIAARLLGVQTKGFSLIPQITIDGRLQMGYVETTQTHRLRDILIRVAPLVSGALFVAYAAIYQMKLLPLWDFLLAAQWDAFWTAIKAVLTLPNFWLWVYLTFTVSSMMMSSKSDRYAWRSLILLIAGLIAVAILASTGTWMMENLAPLLNSFLRALALSFGLSGIIHAILTLSLMLLHWILSKLTGMEVK